MLQKSKMKYLQGLNLGTVEIAFFKEACYEFFVRVESSDHDHFFRFCLCTYYSSIVFFHL